MRSDDLLNEDIEEEDIEEEDIEEEDNGEEDNKDEGDLSAQAKLFGSNFSIDDAKERIDTFIDEISERYRRPKSKVDEAKIDHVKSLLLDLIGFKNQLVNIDATLQELKKKSLDEHLKELKGIKNDESEVWVISTEGGGGHKMFKKSIMDKNPGKAMSTDYAKFLPYGGWFSGWVSQGNLKEGIAEFNEAIREGDAERLNTLVKNQPLLDGLCNQDVTRSVSEILGNNPNLTQVDITEVNGIMGIVRAIDEENQARSRTDRQSIEVNIYITDLLSDENAYMEGITQLMLYMQKKYGQGQKAIPTKVNIKYPAIGEISESTDDRPWLFDILEKYNETQARKKNWFNVFMSRFWQRKWLSGSTVSEVIKFAKSKPDFFNAEPVSVDDLPVDLAYKSISSGYAATKRALFSEMQISRERKKTVMACGSQGRPQDILAQIDRELESGETLENSGDRVITILAARGYENTVAEIKKEHRIDEDGKSLDLQGFANDGKSGVQFELQSQSGGNVIVNILPMIKPALIPELYREADTIVAKAGGVTVMELTNVVDKMDKKPQVKFLTEGCPGWEAKNAQAFQRHFNMDLFEALRTDLNDAEKADKYLDFIKDSVFIKENLRAGILRNGEFNPEAKEILESIGESIEIHEKLSRRGPFTVKNPEYHQTRLKVKKKLLDLHENKVELIDENKVELIGPVIEGHDLSERLKGIRESTTKARDVLKKLKGLKHTQEGDPGEPRKDISSSS